MIGTELPLYSLTEVSFHHFPKHNGDNGCHVEEEKRCAVVFLTTLQWCVRRHPSIFYAAHVFQREEDTPSPTPTLQLQGQMLTGEGQSARISL